MVERLKALKRFIEVTVEYLLRDKVDFIMFLLTGILAVLAMCDLLDLIKPDLFWVNAGLWVWYLSMITRLGVKSKIIKDLKDEKK